VDGHGRRPGINLHAWMGSSTFVFSNCLDLINAAWMASRQLLKPHATSQYTSPKNQMELSQFAAELNEQLLSIGKVLDTCWVASKEYELFKQFAKHFHYYRHFFFASQDTK
jgi:hypothetical protein